MKAKYRDVFLVYTYFSESQKMSSKENVEQCFSWEQPPSPVTNNYTFINQEISSGCGTPSMTSSLRITRQPISRSSVRKYRLGSDEEFRSFRSKCVRTLCNPVTFFILVCIILFTSSVINIIWLENVHSTLEKQFDLPYNLIMRLNEVSFLSTILFWSYIGSKSNRPRVIAVGAILMAIAIGIIALSNVLLDPKQYLTKFTHIKHQSILCTNDSNHTDFTLNDEYNKYNSMSSPMVFLVMLGPILYGIGKAPLFPLSITYLDDSTKEQHTTSIYIAILASAAAGVGLALRLINCLGFLSFSVNKKGNQRKETSHGLLARNVWWPGYVIGCIILLICAIVLLFFPSTPQPTCCRPKKRRRSSSCNSEEVCGTIHSSRKNPSSKETTKLRFKRRICEFFKTGKRMITNWALLPVLLVASGEAALIVCIISYIVSFNDNAFSDSNASALIIEAVIIVLAVIVGNITSCVYVIIRKPTPRQLARSLLVLCVLGVLISLPMFSTGCDNPEISGLPLEESLCGCSCPSNTYSPVCGKDDVTYVTPCHAGCEGVEFNSNESNKVYIDCYCVSSKDVNQTDLASDHVVEGECEWNCDMFIPITIFIASIIFIESFKINPTIIITLRFLPVIILH
ncbi:solute carrier organic anion transporter family member 5A1-like [Anneissia japonica]|uniref:solute carrier organic anion transporter family member 5A1-like n=1 Tax=Anneissia japonica TaxID=1529436 RepID=UPI0014258759|nr:solute carrier organic anion transporter family member 5A1-like [Anneissia japonica]